MDQTTLGTLARRYLDLNGIKLSHFADWIGADRSQVTRWMQGERNLNSDQLERVFAFLSGKFLQKADKINMEEE